MRRLMKMLMARSTERYGKRRLKDIQPLEGGDGLDTTTSQIVLVAREGSEWWGVIKIRLAHTNSSNEQNTSKCNDNAIHFSVSVYHRAPPDLVIEYSQ